MDEGREVDYITDTDSEDEEMYTDNVKTDKYEATGGFCRVGKRMKLPIVHHGI